MVAKPVPRKRGRPRGSTAAAVEKRKRQKQNKKTTNNKSNNAGSTVKPEGQRKKKQLIHNKNDYLDLLFSYTNDLTDTKSTSNSKTQNKRKRTNLNYEPAIDNIAKVASQSDYAKPMFAGSSANPTTMKIDKLICDDIARPHAYINTVKKASTVTVDGIKATKYYDFFEVINHDRVLPPLFSQECINILEWNDKSGKSCVYDAKEISTTAWRHFGLSWHDYMNTVIVTSPFRRDRLILEKIKKLGPPRSINGIRRTFSLGDSRSRRIFFQIFYAPRIAEKSGIKLPESLVLIRRYGQQHSALLPRDYNINASRGFQPPSLVMPLNNNSGTNMFIRNVVPINIFPNACLSGTDLMDPSLYRNKVIGQPVITGREYGNGRISKTIGYPMTYATNITQGGKPTLVRPEPRYAVK
eukprot:g111.t1